jgi:hypothetical protein
MKILAIDPGLISLGYAIFEIINSGKIKHLIQMGSIESNTKKDWIKRLDEIVAEVYRLLDNDTFVVLIELPKIYTIGKKGIAAGNSESIMKLSSLVFSIRQSIRDLRSSVNIKLIPVAVWKGQTPKEITRKRMTKRWGQMPKSNDTVDAVGIGTYYIENMLKLK